MTRIVSAAVLIAIVCAAIWAAPWWVTVVLAALASALAARELAGLGAHLSAAVPGMFASVGAAAVTIAFGVLPAAAVAAPADLVTRVLLAALVAAAALALMSGAPSATTFTRAGLLMMAPIYVGLPLGALAWIRVAEGPSTITWFLAVMAVSDSAQYYSGRAFGRRKLAPLVSPAKTVEGAIGGLVAAAAAGGALAAFGLPGDPTGIAVLLACLLAAAGMVGDLFESLLKRSAGAKDSASVIPGHGGVLDRIDSYLVAAPLFYLYLVSRT